MALNAALHPFCKAPVLALLAAPRPAAIIGAIAGDAGLCTAIGTASGALGGGAYRGLSSNEQYKSAYINCMRDPRPQGDQLIGGDSKSRASNPGSINIYGQGFGCRV